MAGSRQKKERPERKSAHSKRPMPGAQNQSGGCQESGEKQRVREPTVSPEITVGNPEAKSNYVEIRKRRADCASDPHARVSAWPVEARSDGHCGYGIRQKWGQ